MKIIQYIILAAVLVAFDYFTLSAIGKPVVALHNREFIGDWFTGSILDWISFAIFNGTIVIYAIALLVNKSSLYNPVGSNKWNYIFWAALIGTVLLIYIG